MARTYGAVRLSIWRDPEFRRLSMRAQWTYLMLMTQKEVNQCGVQPWVPRKWVRNSQGLSVEEIHEAVQELQSARFVYVDEETFELLVRSYVRHDGVLQNLKFVKGATTAALQVESPVIRRVLGFEFGRLRCELDGRSKDFAERAGKIIAEAAQILGGGTIPTSLQDLEDTSVDREDLGLNRDESGTNPGSIRDRGYGRSECDSWSKDPFDDDECDSFPQDDPFLMRETGSDQGEGGSGIEPGSIRTGYGYGYGVKSPSLVVTKQQQQQLSRARTRVSAQADAPARACVTPPGDHAIRLVDEHLPVGYPGHIRRQLAEHVHRMLTEDRTPPNVLAEAIREWSTRQGARAGLLPYLVGDVLSSRQKPSTPRGGVSEKMADWARLADEVTEELYAGTLQVPGWDTKGLP